MGVRVPPFAPSIHISKDSTRMQTSLETLGELERRLTMSVPVAQIESEIAAAAGAAGQERQGARLPARQGADEDGRAAIRPAGALRRHLRCGARRRFADAIREQNLRIAGYPRIEPKAEAAAPDLLEFSAVFEVYPEVKIGDLSDVDHRAAAGGSRRRRRRAHDRDAAPAAHALRTGRARRGDGRPRDRRFQRHDRRRRVSRRAGERLRDHPRRGPDAAGVRGGGRRA